jgi:hypothetical protein
MKGTECRICVPLLAAEVIALMNESALLAEKWIFNRL